jgi:excinuclease ABC subunit A
MIRENPIAPSQNPSFWASPAPVSASPNLIKSTLLRIRGTPFAGCAPPPYNFWFTLPPAIPAVRNLVPEEPEIANKPAAVDEPASIAVSGARVHNLKNISFEIPHNAITVVTGVSGSGKSSLAFDTIYAEGQRRYIESLSAYARQFLERIEKPDVDEISGIAPAIAIKQKNATRNPRSTVATATEIYDYLRLLYARAGRTFCTRCGTEVRRDTIDSITERVLALQPGLRFYVLYRLTIPEPAKKPGSRKAARPAAENLKQALVDLQKRGFNRLYQARTVHEFSSPETLLDLDFSQPVSGNPLATGRFHRDLLSRGQRGSDP